MLEGFEGYDDLGFYPEPKPNPPCEICEIRQANGTIGDMYDRSFSRWVCEFCYNHILIMRPLGYDFSRYEEDMIRGISLARDEKETQAVKDEYGRAIRVRGSGNE